MKFKLLFVFLFSSLLALSQETQEKYSYAKINYSSIDDLAVLEAVGVPVDHGTHKRGHFLISDFSASEIASARNLGYTVDILIDDSAEHFLQQNQLNIPEQRNPSCDSGASDYVTPDNFNLGSMGGYLTYQEVLDNLDLMFSLYPNLITEKENISTFLTNGEPDPSTTPPIGGNGIKWVKISDNPNATNEGEPQILYDAIHHAREPASLSQLIFYMWYLLENYDTDPEVQNILDTTELYFVPVINPDGYLYNEKTNPNGGGLWRKNRFNSHGVDLNRNYDYFINGDPNNGSWGGEGTSTDPNSNVYHGTAPFSEVETQAMKWFVENHDFVITFNNHTSGNLLLFPYGYTSNLPTPENALFEGITDELVSQNGFNNMIASGLYPAAGNSDDFMYGTTLTHDKIYSMTPEIGPSFWPPSNQIESICKSMMYLNLTSAKMLHNYAKIEETTPFYVGNNTVNNAEFDIKRLGLTGSGDFTVSLTPISANIASVGTPVAFTAMDILDSDSGSIEYILDGSIVLGDDISFELVINNGSVDTSFLINKRFGTLTSIFQDPGDSVTDNYDNNGWDVTTLTFVSPSSSITESPNGNYPNNSNKTITLQDPLNLTNATAANLSFYAKWNIENNWDYTQVEVSIDNGANWIPQCGNYTNEGSTNGGQPTGEPLYDGAQNDWVLEEIDLSDYLGETILIRFEFRSDNEVRADGFYFDDLQISVIDDTLGFDDIEISEFAVFPNPTENELQISTGLSDYTVAIYNIQGQLIRDQSENSGSISLKTGDLSNGVYFLRFTSEGISETIKILKK